MMKLEIYKNTEGVRAIYVNDNSISLVRFQPAKKLELIHTEYLSPYEVDRLAEAVAVAQATNQRRADIEMEAREAII